MQFRTLTQWRRTNVGGGRGDRKLVVPEDGDVGGGGITHNISRGYRVVIDSGMYVGFCRGIREGYAHEEHYGALRAVVLHNFVS